MNYEHCYFMQFIFTLCYVLPVVQCAKMFNVASLTPVLDTVQLSPLVRL
jgi:hypothetical protein